MIENEEGARLVVQSLDEIVYIERRIPDSVFKGSLGDYCWFEFEHVLDVPFWRAMQLSANAHGDESIFAVCLDPHASENFGHSGVARFDVGSDVEEFHNFLDESNDGPISVRTVGNRMAFFGSSCEWAFVGNRSAELTVGAHLGRGGWPKVEGLPYVSFDGALRLAAAPYRKALPDAVADAYARNYGRDSWSP